MAAEFNGGLRQRCLLSGLIFNNHNNTPF